MFVSTNERENTEGLCLQSQAGSQRKGLGRLEVELPDDIRTGEVIRESVIRSQGEAKGIGGEVGSKRHGISINGLQLAAPET